MWSFDDIVGLFRAIVGNWFGLMSGVLGVLMTIAAVFWRTATARRLLAVFGLLGLFVAPAVAWRDEWIGRRASESAKANVDKDKERLGADNERLAGTVADLSKQIAEGRRISDEQRLKALEKVEQPACWLAVKAMEVSRDVL